MTKKEAVQLASTAWRMGIEEKPENIAAGFEEAEIWPLSPPIMLRSLKNFKENDSKAQQPLPSWLVTQQVIRSEILVLPPASEKKSRRKTVDFKRLLLTQDDLRNELQNSCKETVFHLLRKTELIKNDSKHSKDFGSIWQTVS